MKLLIVEGQDAVGKDTLIEGLSKRYPHLIRSHFSFPPGETVEEKHNYQVRTFMQEFAMQKHIRETYGKDLYADGIYIWNRSHIGECVYGPIYRDKDSQWVLDLEKDYVEGDPDAYLVFLYADTDFLIKRDDGKSFTTDYEKRNEELMLFFDAFSRSRIQNKLLIKVNDGENYIDPEKILSSVTKFIDS